MLENFEPESVVFVCDLVVWYIWFSAILFSSASLIACLEDSPAED